MLSSVETCRSVSDPFCIYVSKALLCVVRFPFLAPCFRISCTLSQNCTPRSTSARTSASDYLTLLVENHDLSSEELEIDVNQAASNLNLETSIETTLKNSIVLCRELQTFNQDCTKAKARPISLPRQRLDPSPCPRA